MKALEECATLDGERYVVNLLVEPDLYEEYAQSLGGLRKSSGVSALFLQAISLKGHQYLKNTSDEFESVPL